MKDESEIRLQLKTLEKFYEDVNKNGDYGKNIYGRIRVLKWVLDEE